ncbi:MAG: tRNA preQ1(34) S-adenosylmethionine ribosyltransferase-isomerase QueA [Hyphomicrobiales bacterium]|nr:tRNA preQ1(34) S-adenosylmethionine ribosyltransferase-isomerase QueA [Hyphomicrobiales bacterium]
MRVDAFDFTLPPERIAQQPVSPRDSARMLVVQEALEDHTVRDLPALLQPNDLLILNNTRVIPARLQGKSQTGKSIEITLHRRHRLTEWNAFARPARKVNAGDSVHFAEDFAAEILSKNAGELHLRFTCPEADFSRLLHAHGHMPLPPYIRQGKDTPSDQKNYQTLFARHEGAVAAPTAGLHFTDTLFAALQHKGIAHAFVTLHVGAGTFLPVKTEDTDDHVMHEEWYELPEATITAIQNAKAAGGRIIAVGTTVLRALESSAGDDGTLRPGEGSTRLFITPGYHFKTADILLTNFHLPRSTLFMLDSAFAGLERMQRAYQHAIAQEYRFFSYGDATLLFRGNDA